MKSVFLLLFVLLSSSAWAKATKEKGRGLASVSGNKEFFQTGSLSTSPDRKLYILKTAHQTYSLDRKATFLNNQAVLKKTSPKAQVKLAIKPSYVKDVKAIQTSKELR